MAIVHRTVFSVGSGPGGYTVAVSHVEAGEHRLDHLDEYFDLSFTEALDVIINSLDQRRPGWEYGTDVGQPPLWEPEL